MKQSIVIASPAYEQGEAIQPNIKIYDKIIEYLNDKLRKNWIASEQRFLAKTNVVVY